MDFSHIGSLESVFIVSMKVGDSFKNIDHYSTNSILSLFSYILQWKTALD